MRLLAVVMAVGAATALSSACARTHRGLYGHKQAMRLFTICGRSSLPLAVAAAAAVVLVSGHQTIHLHGDNQTIRADSACQ
jgi:hypothetical protein